MVTDEKLYNTALLRHRLGNLLIGLGVLTWLPFIILRIAGEKPSLFWFLPFHLLGVIGGSRLRSIARKEMNVVLPKRNILQVIGHALIFLGILVWAPYFYLKLVHQPVEVMNYLPFHLTGILGGIMLLLINYFVSRRAEDKV
jgi:polyferredoxin